MGDVRELRQDGMSRLPWIPWDTSCTPPSTLQWFTASQFNIWISAVLHKHVEKERERDKVKIRSIHATVSLLVNRQILEYSCMQMFGYSGQEITHFS